MSYLPVTSCKQVHEAQRLLHFPGLRREVGGVPAETAEPLGLAGDLGDEQTTDPVSANDVRSARALRDGVLEISRAFCSEITIALLSGSQQ